jgi:hypothetical protein
MYQGESGLLEPDGDTMPLHARIRIRLAPFIGGILLLAGLLLPLGCADPHYAPARARRDASTRYAVEAFRNAGNDLDRNLAYLQGTERRIIAGRQGFADDLEATVTGIQSRREGRRRDRRLVDPYFSNRLFFREMTFPPQDFARLIY